jgi:hypothetical protein
MDPSTYTDNEMNEIQNDGLTDDDMSTPLASEFVQEVVTEVEQFSNTIEPLDINVTISSLPGQRSPSLISPNVSNVSQQINVDMSKIQQQIQQLQNQLEIQKSKTSSKRSSHQSTPSFRPLSLAAQNAAHQLQHEAQKEVKNLVSTAQSTLQNELQQNENVQSILQLASIGKQLLNNPETLSTNLVSSLKSQIPSQLLNIPTTSLNQEVTNTVSAIPIVQKATNDIQQLANIWSQPKLVEATGTGNNLAGTGTDMPINRTRKSDRKVLANDILSELPITIRYDPGIYLDNNESPSNYCDDWKQWEHQIDIDDHNNDQLLSLLEEIKFNEQKYKKLSSKHNFWNQTIQTALFIMGTAIVYVQASGTTPEVVNRFNVASGIGTSVASLALSIGKFAKKSPHFAIIASNLSKLRSWIENKLILPREKRFSPFDIFIIAKMAKDSILLQAKTGLEDSKS